MKKILMTAGLFLVVAGVFAQKNNPFNERGIQYVESLEIIRADLEAGKVKDFNEESIRHYASTLPIQGNVSVETVAEIVATLKDPGFNFEEQLEKARISDYAKEFLSNLPKSKETSLEEYKESLIGRVDVVRHSEIDDEEKEMLLTQVAITYNLIETNISLGEPNCWLTINGIYPDTRMECAVGGAIAGLILGTIFCGGPWCYVVFGLVGGILGFLS